jgi:4-hydroxy-4-methyl-2-oxoglutarate aldolase
MTDYTVFQSLSPTTLADVLSREQVMNFGIRPLWADMPRVAGPAYPVRCAPGDNLMLHAAIYRAPPGSIIVIEAGDTDYALVGGNVCAVAQKRGIAAFVTNGVIRDLAEVRAMRFPVFACGVSPIPGAKDKLDLLNERIHCGGVEVSPGDIVVADEEWIVVVPVSRADSVLTSARLKAAKDDAQTLDAWEAAHRARIDEILRSKGFTN